MAASENPDDLPHRAPPHGWPPGSGQIVPEAAPPFVARDETNPLDVTRLNQALNYITEALTELPDRDAADRVRFGLIQLLSAVGLLS